MRTVRYLRDALIALRRHGKGASRLRKAIVAYVAKPAAHANNVTQLAGSPAKRRRVGDYRIVFQETDTEIVVARIAPRGSAYD